MKNYKFRFINPRISVFTVMVAIAIIALLLAFVTMRNRKSTMHFYSLQLSYLESSLMHAADHYKTESTRIREANRIIEIQMNFFGFKLADSRADGLDEMANKMLTRAARVRMLIDKCESAAKSPWLPIDPELVGMRELAEFPL